MNNVNDDLIYWSGFVAIAKLMWGTVVRWLRLGVWGNEVWIGMEFFIHYTTNLRLRFIVAKIFWSYSNLFLLIFIWSCELASKNISSSSPNQMQGFSSHLQHFSFIFLLCKLQKKFFENTKKAKFAIMPHVVGVFQTMQGRMQTVWINLEFWFFCLQ